MTNVPKEDRKNLIFDEKKEKPNLYALIEMNIFLRSETDFKKCTDFNIYSAAKDPLLFLSDIVQTHGLAPTRDPLGDADTAVQAYHICSNCVAKLPISVVLEWKLRLRL